MLWNVLETDALFAILPVGVCLPANPAKGIHLAVNMPLINYQRERTIIGPSPDMCSMPMLYDLSTMLFYRLE